MQRKKAFILLSAIDTAKTLSRGGEGIINKKNICIRLISWHCCLNGMSIIFWITVVIHGLQRRKFFEPRGSHLSRKDRDKDKPEALRHLTTML